MRPVVSTGLSTTALRKLLSTSNLAVESGADRLLADLSLAEPLGEYIKGAPEVSYDSTVAVGGSVQVTMPSTNPVGRDDFIRPWVRLTDLNTGVTARFNCGVYTLVSPRFSLSQLQDVDYTGYDLCYLLQQDYPDSYYLSAGSSVTEEVVRLITEILPYVVVNVITPDEDTLDSDITIALSGTPYTYLTIINALLAAVGCDNLWADWEGVLQINPYVKSLEREVEWYFNADDEFGAVGPDREVSQDTYNIPNCWVFIMDGLTAEPVEGSTQFTYEDYDPGSPSSLANSTRFQRVYFVSATSYAALVQAGYAQVTRDKAPVETITFKTPPIPIAWRLDQLFYYDSALAEVPPSNLPYRRCVGVSWTMPLDGSDMSWTSQTATL